MADAFGISAEIKNADKLIKAFKQAPRVAREEITRATWEAELLFEREAKDLTPVGVGGGGGLRGSISAQAPQRLRDSIIGIVGTSAAHAVPVELGTKPHFPPLEPLIDWVRVKLDVSEERAPGVALKIARKIAARGTVAVGMFHRALAENRQQIDRMYELANVRILQRMVHA